jgi:hypothetical protein
MRPRHVKDRCIPPFPVRRGIDGVNRSPLGAARPRSGRLDVRAQHPCVRRVRQGHRPAPAAARGGRTVRPSRSRSASTLRWVVSRRTSRLRSRRRTCPAWSPRVEVPRVSNIGRRPGSVSRSTMRAGAMSSASSATLSGPATMRRVSPSTATVRRCYDQAMTPRMSTPRMSTIMRNRRQALRGSDDATRTRGACQRSGVARAGAGRDAGRDSIQPAMSAISSGATWPGRPYSSRLPSPSPGIARWFSAS